MGKLPILTDGDAVVTEAVAIGLYLADYYAREMIFIVLLTLVVVGFARSLGQFRRFFRNLRQVVACQMR